MCGCSQSWVQQAQNPPAPLPPPEPVVQTPAPAPQEPARVA